MKNMKVAAKLVVGFIIVAALTGVVGAVGIYGMSALAQADKRMYEENLTAVEAMGDIREAFQQERVYFRDILINIDDPDVVEAYIEKINAAHLRGDAAVGRYMGAATDPALESAFFEAGALLDVDGDYTLAKEKIMQSARAGDAEGVLEGIEAAAAYVSTIEDGLAISEKNHVAWASDQYRANTALSRTLTVAQTVIIGAACLIAVLLGVYLSAHIGKPLVSLTNFMNKAGETGDISLGPEDIELIGKLSQVRDEIGRCIGSCAKFVARILDANKVLETIADGDLTAELPLLSDKDSMGLSFRKVAKTLNDMFGEIKSSAAQVSTGSKQIADGAQSLAQGSTEQASAIEELSAAISMISDKTKQNADIAKESAKLSEAIMGNAEKGSAQMDHMMQAVRDINDAGSQIGQVIKAIDDIAFQTNILALNAAVEAARAGPLGKGFAVVAEEVRHLAAKSAEAAKDSGILIENSIGKANLGLDIASETAVSLKEIVDGIRRSAEIASQLADLSDEQAESIVQINMGIDQVAQVVHQTSATAEESAAASEEMSGQSDMLTQLTTRFKLKASELHPLLSSAPNAEKFSRRSGTSFV